ncbi:MAG: tripartite tricarboxylate transporter substrate binding protein [Pyrinomonadaceae bacterium]
MKLFSGCIAIAMSWACVNLASAAVPAAYPDKPIRLIVPFPPGGGTDILARMVAHKLTEANGWQFVFDNRPGAGGNIGLDLAAKAAPDGYTMVMGQTSNPAVNPNLYSKLPYDSLKDFAPVTLVSSMPIALMVWGKSPYLKLSDLIDAAKSKPDALTRASTGNGTIGHLSGELLQRAAGIKMIHVPYKGAAQAFPDLLGGRLTVFFSSVETALPQVQGGIIRVLAVTSTHRVPALKNVPTVAESGYKGVEASTWFGLLVPAKTPANIVARLSEETSRVLGKPDMRDRLASAGEQVTPGPDTFAALLKADYAKWGKIVRDAGVKVE